MDLGIEVILELFSKQGLEDIFNIAHQEQSISSKNASRIYSLRADYTKTVDFCKATIQAWLDRYALKIICPKPVDLPA